MCVGEVMDSGTRNVRVRRIGSPNQRCSYTIKVVQGLLGCDVEQSDWLFREGYKYGALT